MLRNSLTLAFVSMGLLVAGCGGETPEELAKKETELVAKLQTLLKSVQTADDAKNKATEIAGVASELAKVKTLMVAKGAKSTAAAAKDAVKQEFERLKANEDIKKGLGAVVSTIEKLF